MTPITSVRIQGVLEEHRGRQQLRQEDAEEFAEYMAERQEVQEAQGMKDALVAQILADLALQRLQVGQDVAVRNDHAARLRRGARGEDNLDDVIAGERRWGDRRIRVLRQGFAQQFQLKLRHAGDEVRRGAHAEASFHLGGHALREVGGRNLIDRHHDGAAQDAAEEGDNPLGAILAPQDDLVVLADAASFQFAGEAVGAGQNFAVAPALHTIAAAMHIRGLARVAPEIVEVFQDGGACHQQTVYKGTRSVAPNEVVLKRHVFTGCENCVLSRHE